MKKLFKNGLLFFMMAALIGIIFMPGSVKAAGVSYTFIDGVVTISGSGVADDNSMWKEQMGNVEKVVVNDGITGIGDFMFSGCYNLASLELADSVVTIGTSAFDGCASLTSVKLPAKVQKLGFYSFNNCMGITEITIPKTVKDAGHAFVSSGVETVTFENGSTLVPEFIMADCKMLKNIVWTDSITEIGTSAFDGCTSLTSVKLPAKVQKLGFYSFNNCTGITKITIPKTVKDAGHAFVNSGVETVTFENGSTLVAGFIMADCKMLKNIIWPNSITEIGTSAFEGCTALTSVKLPVKVKKLGFYAFNKCMGITKITIPKTVIDAGHAFVNSGIETVTFENGIKEIPGFIMADCKALKNIVWGNTITAIGTSAFEGCSNLTNVTMPWYLKKIDFYAFNGCSGLEKVTIYQNVSDINTYAFKGVSGFTIYGKKGSKANTFAKENKIRFSTRCKIPALKGITYTSRNIKYKVVDDKINGKGTVMVVGLKKAAKSVFIPATVKLESYKYKVVKINTKAFYKQSKLKTVTIKSKYIKTIGKNAFKGIYKKATIQVPKAKYSAYKKMLKKAGVTSRMKLKKK